MARSKKEERKWTPEERALDVWNQQLFFIRKTYPHAEDRIQNIVKKFHSKKKDESFIPPEEATNALRDLYTELKGAAPRAPLAH